MILQDRLDSWPNILGFDTRLVAMSPSWNFPARAEPSYEVPSQAEPSWGTLISELKPS